ncbi:MAG: hypothetical protein ABI576_17265 [Flavobacterium sp.]
MENFTIDDYKLAIQTKFKNDNFLIHSIDPKPAKLRDVCLDILRNCLNKKDEIIFKWFFKPTEDLKLEKAIVNCEVSKFKPIISFLKGGNTEDRERIEMAAILVDQKPRPFLKFKNGGTESESFENEEVDDEIANVEKTNNRGTVDNDQDVRSEKVNDKADEENKIPKSFIGIAPKITNKKHIVLLTGIFAVIGGFIIWDYKNEGDCMVWNKDHYEVVSCDMVSNKMFLVSPIVTKKEESIISNFKKIKVCDTTSFFKMGKPCVWYGKSFDGSYDCFTAPGLHPETGKTLKPITGYIVKKHILKNKEE